MGLQLPFGRSARLGNYSKEGLPMSYQVMPDLAADDFAALKADIAARGVLVPVEYDEDGNVLDGHHRVRACQELGINDWPRFVRKGLSEDEKRLHARQLNLARRHLNQAQKRELIAAQLKDTPAQSNRQIAGGLGVSDNTVRAVRDELESIAQIARCDRQTKDGRTYPAERKPIRTAYVDPSPEGEREVLGQAKALRAQKVEHKRAVKIAQTEQIAEQNRALPFGARKYSVIYADPPWSFDVWSGAGKDRAAENHYPTMSQKEIEALPVARLATDDCALFMWAVMPQLPEALEVIRAWGFEYKTVAFVWVKTTKDGNRPATGMGYWTRANAEVCLLATKGSPVRLNADVHQVIQSARLEHSAKPDEAALRIERLVPGPYLELFARRRRDGWDVWGNQLESAD